MELVKDGSISDFHANQTLSEGGRESWIDASQTAMQSKEGSARLLGSP